MRNKQWHATPEGNAQAMREMRDADENVEAYLRRFGTDEADRDRVIEIRKALSSLDEKRYELANELERLTGRRA